MTLVRRGWTVIRVIGVLGGILVISSCVSSSADFEGAGAGAVVGAGGVIEVLTGSHYVTARDFLVGNQQPNSLTYAYGYLLFTHRPANNAESDRYVAVCTAYITRFELVRDYTSNPIYEVMPTYWLLKPDIVNTESQTCPALVKFYNYARAHAIAAEFGVSAIDGPLLVARTGAFQRDVTGSQDARQLLTYDLSRYSNEDMTRALGIWSARVGEDPDRWRNGFYLTKFREGVRNLLQTSGAEVANVLIPESTGTDR